MAVQLLYTPVLFSLPLFLTQVYAQESPNYADYDRFYFPSSYSKPVYYNEDTLLVKYGLEQTGPISFLTLSLKCVGRTDNSEPPWNLDVSKGATVGRVKRDIPVYVGTVPFDLPPLPDYQTVYGPPACAFVLNGWTRSSGDPVTIQSSIIQIGYDGGHHQKTYISEGSKGEVPNGNYRIIDGNGTYDIKSGGLSAGAKAGIGAGVAVGAIALLALGFFLWWRRRRQKAKVLAGATSISDSGENKRDDEARVGELHGDHVKELGKTHNRPPHEIGPGVERAELGVDGAHQRFELP